MGLTCVDCGVPLIDLSGFRWVTDSGQAWCKDCIRDKPEIAWRHELARRVHFSAHGTDERGCEKCRVENAASLLWGDPRMGGRGE